MQTIRNREYSLIAQSEAAAEHTAQLGMVCGEEWLRQAAESMRTSRQVSIASIGWCEEGSASQQPACGYYIVHTFRQLMDAMADAKQRGYPDLNILFPNRPRKGASLRIGLGGWLTGRSDAAQLYYGVSESLELAPQLQDKRAQLLLRVAQVRKQFALRACEK